VLWVLGSSAHSIGDTGDRGRMHVGGDGYTLGIMSRSRAPANPKGTKTRAPQQATGRTSRGKASRQSTHERPSAQSPNHPPSNHDDPRERSAKRAHDEFLSELSRSGGKGFNWSND